MNFKQILKYLAPRILWFLHEIFSLVLNYLFGSYLNFKLFLMLLLDDIFFAWKISFRKIQLHRNPRVLGTCSCRVALGKPFKFSLNPPSFFPEKLHKHFSFSEKIILLGKKQKGNLMRILCPPPPPPYNTGSLFVLCVDKWKTNTPWENIYNQSSKKDYIYHL